MALALAVEGTSLFPSKQELKVYFPDITGIKVSSQVKYNGAPAGKVIGVEMLDDAERLQSGNPANTVLVVLGLDADVPALPGDVQVSIAADTLLSDKFILLSGGNPDGPKLAQDRPLQGIRPTTFDKLTRETDAAITDLREVLTGDDGAQMREMVPRLQQTLRETQSLLTEARGTLQEARAMIATGQATLSEAQSLLQTNRASIERSIQQADRATASLELVAQKGDKILSENQAGIRTIVTNLSAASGDFRQTIGYAKIFTKTVAERPQALVWGTGRPPKNLPPSHSDR